MLFCSLSCFKLVQNHIYFIQTKPGFFRYLLLCIPFLKQSIGRTYYLNFVSTQIVPPLTRPIISFKALDFPAKTRLFAKKTPRPLHKANEQGIKKGRISIQKFLFCDTNSMTRFR